MLSGISEDEFWNLTPAELERRQWAALEQQRRAQRSLIVQAWWIVALDRQKRLPSLVVLLNPTRRLTGDELARRHAEHEAIVQRFAGR